MHAKRQLARTWVFYASSISALGACGASTGSDASQRMVEKGAPAPPADGVVPTLTASDAGALQARIEDIAGLEIELVTVSCAGACADIVAAARGGNPPYSFEWDDGSAVEARRVCPLEDQQLTLAVTDTAFENTEFGYEAQTARTAVTAKVLECPDAGPPAADAGSGEPDAGAPRGASCGYELSESAADGCTVLSFEECLPADGQETSLRLYTLPSFYLPDATNCLVAFGNVQTAAAEPSLQFEISAAWTVFACAGGAPLRQASDYLPPNAPGQGHTICLSEPPVTPNDALMVIIDPKQIRSFGDLELRWCDVCPTAL
jgi:hypothetical protein